jgi:hypothetical protein
MPGQQDAPHSSRRPAHVFRRPMGSGEGFAFTDFSYLQGHLTRASIPSVATANGPCFMCMTLVLIALVLTFVGLDAPVSS